MKIKIARFFIALVIYIFLSIISFCGNCFANESNEILKMNIDEAVNASEKIFTGLCINKEEVNHPGESEPPKIEYTFKIVEAIKDGWDNEEIKFTLLKEDSAYKPGKKYLLFLSPPAEDNTIKLVDLMQGELEIKRIGLIKKGEVLKKDTNIKRLGKNTKIKRIFSINSNRSSNYCMNKLFKDKKIINSSEFIQLIKLLLPSDLY